MSDLEPKPKKNTSEAQGEASRANGAKSRGPSTPSGKSTSSMNRLTHGLCSNVPLIKGEDPVEHAQNRRRFFDDWTPQGATEIALVEELARSAWLIRRADTSNEANVSTAMRKSVVALDAAQIAEHSRLVNLLPKDPATAAPLLRQSGPGCRFLIGRCESLVEALDARTCREPSERVRALEILGKRTADLFDDDAVYDICFTYQVLGAKIWTDGTTMYDALGLDEPEDKTAQWEFRRRADQFDAAVSAAAAESEKSDAFLRDWLGREVADLTQRAAVHEEREAADRADAPWCVAVDVSPAGQARSRYEARHQRAFQTALRNLLTLRKSDVKEPPAELDLFVLPEAVLASLETRSDGSESGPSNVVLATDSEAPIPTEHEHQAAAPNEPEPPPAAPSTMRKMAGGNRLQLAETKTEVGPEMIWVPALGSWFIKGTIDLKEVERIEDRRRANNVWCERDFLPKDQGGGGFARP